MRTEGPFGSPLGAWIRRALTTFSAIAGLFHHFASAQDYQFHLKNGDRLTGRVVAEDGTKVIITNSLIGRVLIPAEQLERREPLTPPVVAVPSPTPPPKLATNLPAAVAAPPVTPDQRKRLEELVQVYMAGQMNAAEFERRRAALLAIPKPPAPSRWSGEVLAGFDAGIGTKNREFFTGRFKLNYGYKRIRNTLDYLFTYGHTEGELAANRMDANDKMDISLNERYYTYVLGGGGYDEIRKIDYYFQAGPGVGKHLINRTNFVLNAELGANYQSQNFEGGKDAYLFYYRLAQDSKWIVSPRLSLDQKVEYTPQWDDFSQFKIRGEVNLRYLLRSNLSLVLSLIDLYDTRVAEGISPNDLQIRSSIGVKF